MPDIFPGLVQVWVVANCDAEPSNVIGEVSQVNKSVPAFAIDCLLIFMVISSKSSTPQVLVTVNLTMAEPLLIPVALGVNSAPVIAVFSRLPAFVGITCHLKALILLLMFAPI